MIHARWDKSTGEIVLEGHARANRNEWGHDLVCCAASVLIDAYHYAALREGYEITAEADKGYKRIVPADWQRNAKELHQMQRHTVYGLEMLSSQWPQCIRLEISGDYERT